MIKYNKKQLERVAKKYKLKFVILHGSHATGLPHKGSDLDIAVLGKNEITFGDQIKLHGEFSDIFGDTPQRELDLKTLHKIDSLFRYEVVRDGVLIFGDSTDYEDFKAFAYRAYEDERPLRELEAVLSKKYQRHLNKITLPYA